MFSLGRLTAFRMLIHIPINMAHLCQSAHNQLSTNTSTIQRTIACINSWFQSKKWKEVCCVTSVVRVVEKKSIHASCKSKSVFLKPGKLGKPVVGVVNQNERHIEQILCSLNSNLRHVP